MTDDTTSQLRWEYVTQQALLAAQAPLVQRFLEAQAHTLAEAIVQKVMQLRFKLPDQVVVDSETDTLKSVPVNMREQQVGGVLDRIARNEMRMMLKQRLMELESSQDKAVSVSAGLIRYVTSLHMIRNMLPAGRTVKYTAAPGEEIPSIPVKSGFERESAITAQSDAIVEESKSEQGRGELQVPFVPAARRFYLPQWVAFDDHGKLLVGDINEAEAHIGSMQRFLWILHAAVGLTSYILVDEEYQQKRYGMLGQFVNQGRALARYQTMEIIRTIKRRARSSDLNRGLSISLPYFDDQDLMMKTYFFEVIPSGRIMFVPAFVVRAAGEESAKIAQDTRLSPSTRKHILEELLKLEQAFSAPTKHT